MPFGPVGPDTDSFSLTARLAQILQEENGDADSQLSPELRLAQLNAAYAEMNQMAMTRANANLLTYADITSDGTTGLLDWTWNQFRGRMVSFRWCQNAANSGSLSFRNELLTQRADCMQNYIPSGGGSGGWAGWGSVGINERDGLLYTMDTTHTIWRAWFLRQPRDLLYGLAAGGSTTTIILPTTPTQGQTVRVDDWYKSEVFMATPTGGYQQTGKVTAYSAATKTLTLRSVDTPTGVPFSSGSGIVSGNPVSSVPWFSSDYWELLCLKAAKLFTKRNTSQDNNDKITTMEGQFNTYLGRDDMGSQRTTVNQGNFDVGLGGDGLGGGFTPGSIY